MFIFMRGGIGMKKIIIGLCCLGTMLILGACDVKPEQAVEEIHYGVDAKVKGFDTLNEMEEYADAIIRVTRKEGETSVIQYSGDVVQSGFSFSEVVVEEIYVDKTGEIQVGECIKMLENEFYSEKENIIYHVAGYNMMEADKEYLLFVNKAEYTDKSIYYVASGVVFGTISLESDNRAVVRRNVYNEVVMNLEVAEPLWEAAIEKYID